MHLPAFCQPNSPKSYYKKTTLAGGFFVDRLFFINDITAVSVTEVIAKTKRCQVENYVSGIVSNCQVNARAKY